MRGLFAEDRFEAIAPTQDLFTNIASGTTPLSNYQGTEVTVVTSWYAATRPTDKPHIRLAAGGSTLGPRLLQESALGGIYASTESEDAFGNTIAQVDVPPNWNEGVPHVIASRARPNEVDVRTMLDYAAVTFDGAPEYLVESLEVTNPTPVNAIAIYRRWLTDWEVVNVMAYLRRATTPEGVYVRSWPVPM
ncbi:hypothetical protein CLV30_106127 [Haloactinopolyspora alba]|uniref:Uncharacterized protein n=1 Tax=Haloactinopolyspora alba TaxID=648780 RepID=A0A2P8E3S0_9ACTN|nr:hypothetical protein [Haloactinopolyspora alba]PSL04122.1 hypothetical protein CLV30_106127 [Haloactinopolyspora alba]